MARSFPDDAPVRRPRRWVAPALLLAIAAGLAPLEAAGAANLFVVRDGVARLTRVRLGALHDGTAEVREGLAETELVVANPPPGLEDLHRVGVKR